MGIVQSRPKTTVVALALGVLYGGLRFARRRDLILHGRLLFLSCIFRTLLHRFIVFPGFQLARQLLRLRLWLTSDPYAVELGSLALPTTLSSLEDGVGKARSRRARFCRAQRVALPRPRCLRRRLPPLAHHPRVLRLRPGSRRRCGVLARSGLPS